MVRSIDKWSGGTKETEKSIQEAYIDLIGKAEHFIYIEVISIKNTFLYDKNENFIVNQ